MKVPKISIIVPIYNATPYIHRCIDSILSQSFIDYELLLIDDGSTDESGAICDEYATKDARIRVFHKKNGGVSSARNLGLDNAKGEWIYFVDADDEVMPEGLNFLLFGITQNTKLCIGGYNVYEDEHCVYHIDDDSSGFEGINDALFQMFSSSPYRQQAYLWNKLFFSKNIDGLRFDTSIKFSEDRLFIVSYLLNLPKDATIYYAWKPMYKHIERPTGAMASTKQSFNRDFLTDLVSYRKIYDLLRKFKIEKYIVEAHHNYMLDSYSCYINMMYKHNTYTYRLRLEAETQLLKGLGCLSYLKYYIKKLLRKLKHISKKLCYAIRDIGRYRYSPTYGNWKKFGDHPVLGSLETCSLFDPYAFVNSSIFIMLVSERSNNGIDRYESQNGQLWGYKGNVLSCIPNTWQHLVNRATMVKHNGMWHLWYTGQSPHVSCIGHSVSQDGVHFENAPSPCLSAELEHEGMSVMNPCVLWNNKKQVFQMWYAAGENYEPDVICYAESKDGDHWNKWDEPVLTKYVKHRWEKAKVGGCDVVLENDGSYTMYYIGYQNVDLARICYAQSNDGIHWMRPKHNLLLSPSKNSWDADACYKPTVVKINDTLYMWYNGRKENEEYIGLATKKIR